MFLGYFPVQQATYYYRIGNRVYYWVWLRPDHTSRMRYVNVVDAWGACGARERCLELRYRGMRRNTCSRTSREVEALMDQLVGRTPPSYRTGSHILPSFHITSNLPSHTRTLQISGRTPLELWCISQG